MKAVVIGDGGWGTALAMVLRGKGHEVALWGPFPDYMARMRETRLNPLYLPGVELPSGLACLADPAEAAAGADLVVLAVPTKFYRSVIDRFRGLIAPGALLVSVAKGFDPETGARMSDVAEAVLGAGPVVALSGPSHAEEVARRAPTCVVAACRDHDLAVRAQEAFIGTRFRVYTSSDVVGVEMGGALKNVIALAVGLCDGLGFGDNSRAALITRGLAEMTRLGVAYGAQAGTFAGLSGIGDLIVTCTSKLSRNRSVGERLGRGETLEQVTDSMKQVAEGVTNCLTARELALKKGIEAPIVNEVHAILYEGRKPEEVLDLFMARIAKPEIS
ncbi:MAG: NAD(P)H-dependent glycerol-3-phosphate dehydrogenase [Kiritimatiellia bacterium]